MASKHDVIVVGSGHNGLIAAAYLAKAGKSVLVLERNTTIGGGATTEETAARGFHHDTHAAFHVLIQANPLLVDDELGLLSKFGLRYVFPEAVLSSVFDDGDAVVTYRDLDRTCESMSRISAKDAATYRVLVDASLSRLPELVKGMFRPPPPQGALWAQLDRSPAGRMQMRMLQQSMLEVVDERFESEKIKIHLMKAAAELLVTPTERGAGGFVASMAAFAHAYAWGIPLGGSRALIDALARCLQEHGAEIRTNAEVSKITTSGGAATGVTLRGGETIRARTVIGQIHPWLLADIVEGIDAEIGRAARGTLTASYALIANHYALKEKVRFRVPEDAAQAAYMSFVPSSLEHYLRSFDDLGYGDLPRSRVLGAFDLTRWDPQRAPAGGSTLTLLGYGPYALRHDGAAGWDRRREQLQHHLPTLLGDLCENLTPENILGSAFLTPLDAERHSPTFQHGDVGGIGKAFFQTGSHRPTPDLSGYRVPGIDGLYLAGASMHPPGGLTGGGRATAMQICGDLGVDFETLRKMA